MIGRLRSLLLSTFLLTFAKVSLLQAATLTIVPAFPPGGFAGFPYSVTFSASGGTAPYTFSKTAGDIPPGLSLTSGGVLSGTATAGGSYYFEITAQDGSGNSGTIGINVFFTGPQLTVSPSSIPDGAVGQPYSVTFSATGGTGNYTFHQAIGTIPGLVLDGQTGVLSGTPTLSGPFTFRIDAQSGASTGSRTYTINIAGNNNLLLGPASLPGGTVGRLYGETVFVQAAPGGAFSSPATWSVAGPLPPGISLQPAPDRVDFRGTPTAAGTYAFQLTARDAANRTATLSYSIVIVAPTISVSPDSLSQGFANVPYEVNFSASGGTPPYTFAPFGPAAGAISAWLSPSGTLRFTPVSGAEWDFSIRATDNNGAQGTRDYHLSITAPTLSVSPTSLPSGTLNTPYSAQFEASGGTAPYTFSLGGTVPSGLSFSSSGLLNGSPSQAGLFNSLTVTARDATGAVGSRSYQLVINGLPIQLGPASLPDAIGKQPYAAQITATGGTPPYTFAMPSANPWVAGLSMSSDGLISGTPDDGNAILHPTIVATDSVGSSGSRTFDLRLKPSTPAVITYVGPRTFTVGQGTAVSISISVSGGAYPVAFSAQGNLPPGITLSGDNVHANLQGTAPPAGSYNFTLRATDVNGTTATETFTLVSNAPTLSFSPVHLPSASEGQTYSVQFQGTGGTPPYSFSVTSGQLPAGLTLTSSGLLSGIAALPRNSAFTIAMRDSQNATFANAFTFSVTPLPISIGPDSLPDATLGQAYSAQLTATNARPPFSFSLESPGDFNVSADGLISGTPQGSPGARTLAVRVIDDNATSGSRTYTINVLNPPNSLTITTQSLTPAVRGSSYLATLSASGGTAPYAFQITQGSLAPGMTMSQLGVLSGVPTSAGTFPLTITVTDGQNRTASREFTLTVSPGQVTNSLLIDPYQLHFHIAAAGPRVSGPQCIAVLTTAQSATAQGSLSGSPLWARLTASQLQTPGSFCLTADATSLAPGSYSNSLTVQASGTQPTSASIQLNLIVDPTSPARFIAPSRVSASSSKDGGVQIQSFVVSNEGGQSASFLFAQPSVGWLRLSPFSGQLAPGGSTSIAAQFDPSGLESGVYDTAITLTGAGSPIVIPSSLAVAPPEPGLLVLSQHAIEFTAWQGGSAVTTTIGMVNQGAVLLSPSLATEAPWLKVQPVTSTLPPGSAKAIEVTADPSTLAAGYHASMLTAQAPGAINGKQTVAMGLTVLPQNAALPAESHITGLALTPFVTQGSIVVTLAPGGGLTFTTTIKSADTGWLTISPAQGTVPASGKLTLNATAHIAGQGPGLYTALVALGLSDGTVRSIPVELFIPEAAAQTRSARSAQQVCGSANGLVAHMLSPEPGFSARSGRAVQLRVQAEFCNGRPAENLEVIVHAGGQETRLLPEAPGLWSGSWVPAISGSIVLRTSASQANPQASAVVEVAGQVTATPPSRAWIKAVAPAATQITDDPAVPGSWLTIYGENLAAAEAVARTTPFPTRLGGIRVLLGDVALPLYYVSATQLNVLTPWSLLPGVNYQLSVERDGQMSTPTKVAIAAVKPGLFTLNQQGNGQAAALLAGTSTLAAGDSPVSRNEVLELYGTGFGAVDQTQSDGHPASLTQLARTVAPVSVTVGGRPAQVLFSGLSPGTVGLYQINVRIPADAPSGSEVEVVATQQGARSNAVTVAIR